MAETPANLPGSRRNFLRRLAQGTAALAAAPIMGIPAEALARPLPRLADGAPADEAYWTAIRSRFVIRDGLVPMNAANLCPAPRSVIDASIAAMHDVDGDVSHQNRAKYDALLTRVRERMAAFLGAGADEIAIVRNASEANNIVVGGLTLGTGDEVVLFDENHPTNNVAWDVRAARYGFTVRRVRLENTPGSAAEILDAFARELTPRTRVLAFSDVSNTTGVRIPTRELCHLARSRGIYTHVDGAQTLGALVRDVHDLGCDSYAASAHKWLMGPKEAGVLFVRRDRIADVWPGVVGVGWGSSAEPSARGARRLETLGQRNDATIAGLDAAMDLHDAIGIQRVEARMYELTGALKAGLRQMPRARVVTPLDRAISAGVVVTRFEGLDNRAIYERLYREHGIAGAPTGGVRLCPHVYNTLADVQRTLDALGAVAGSLG